MLYTKLQMFTCHVASVLFDDGFDDRHYLIHEQNDFNIYIHYN